MSIQVGQKASVKWIFSQEDFDRFAILSGDDNPIHVDPEFSAQTKFGRTVAHGMLLYSTVCGVLGTRLPGPGTLQLEQELMFPNPTFAGEQVTIQLEVTGMNTVKGLADLTTTVTKSDGNVGLRGRTLVRLPGKVLNDHLSQEMNQPTDQLTHGANRPTFKGLRIGQQAQTERIFTTHDLAEYADLTGDTNPIFTDIDYAQRQGLDGPMIPGGLLGGLFSYLLGTQLPGRGTNYLKQRLAFPIPAYAGQELTAAVEIVRLRPEKQLVNLSTTCTNPHGQTICYGEALVLVSDIGKLTSL